MKNTTKIEDKNIQNINLIVNHIKPLTAFNISCDDQAIRATVISGWVCFVRVFSPELEKNKKYQFCQAVPLNLLHK